MSINWEPGLTPFIFREEVPGRHKMHTKPLDIKNWIQIDNTYPQQMELRYNLLEGPLHEFFVSREQPSTSLAKEETLEMLINHILNRFPNLFQRKNEKTIFCTATKKEIEIGSEDPLITAAKLVQEDFCIMEWNDEHQQYILTAGIVLFPMRWSLTSKFNKTFGHIHVPVKVFAGHLQETAEDLFKELPTHAPVWRANWAIFNDLKGPLDLVTPESHTKRNSVNFHSKINPNTGRELVLREEYQTLRRLPKSKAILFSIRTYQRYLEEIANFPPGIIFSLVTAIKNINGHMIEYKGADFWRETAIIYLNQLLEKKGEMSAAL